MTGKTITARVGAASRRDRNRGGAKSAQLRRERTLQLRLLRLVLYRHGRVQLPGHPRRRTVGRSTSHTRKIRHTRNTRRGRNGSGSGCIERPRAGNFIASLRLLVVVGRSHHERDKNHCGVGSACRRARSIASAQSQRNFGPNGPSRSNCYGDRWRPYSGAVASRCPGQGGGYGHTPGASTAITEANATVSAAFVAAV